MIMIEPETFHKRPELAPFVSQIITGWSTKCVDMIPIAAIFRFSGQDDVRKSIFNSRVIFSRKNFAPGFVLSDY
jgi:hypothetical protein